MNADFWNQRYAEEGFAYGDIPNEYFKQEIQRLTPGKLLLPAEGQGRNAVYAAGLGWQVDCFDLSEVGKQRSFELAHNMGVTIQNYWVGNGVDLELTQQYTAVGLIYSHFAPSDKRLMLAKIAKTVIPGGVIIAEVFSKDHVKYKQANPKVGGPGEIDVLFSEDEFMEAFEDFDMEYLQTKEVDLTEGLYHQGIGSVVRMIARKK